MSTQSDHLTLNLLIRGFQVSQMLRLAAELGVADQLLEDGERDVCELAHSCGVLPIPLLRVLRALAAFSVFRLTPKGGVAHTPLSLLLRDGVANSLRPAALNLAAPGSWRAWGALDAAMTGGVPHHQAWNTSRFEYLRDHPDEGRNFDLFMSNDPEDHLGAVAAAYDFSGARLIGDIGGGNGALLRKLLARNPGPRGLVFDREHVVAAIAPTDLLGGRIEAVPGSFFDHVPIGASHYLLVRVMHDWPDEDCLRILRNCRTAMSADARLLIIEQILEPDPSFGPPLQYLSDMQMMAMFGSAGERTLTEYNQLLCAAGFAVARVVATRSPFSIIEAVAQQAAVG
jgi:hypothetical protein